MAEATRSTTITDAHAKPINEREKAVAWQAIVAALRGVWGTGPWDGGIGGTGDWEKHSKFWDATLQADISGDVTITFPFTVVKSVVKVWKMDLGGTEATLSASYIESGKTLLVSHSGRIVVELSRVKNTKEA